MELKRKHILEPSSELLKIYSSNNGVLNNFKEQIITGDIDNSYYTDLPYEAPENLKDDLENNNFFTKQDEFFDFSNDAVASAHEKESGVFLINEDKIIIEKVIY